MGDDRDAEAQVEQRWVPIERIHQLIYESAAEYDRCWGRIAEMDRLIYERSPRRWEKRLNEKRVGRKIL